MQRVALLLALAAVLLLSLGLVAALIAIGLALSFGLYGAVKKVVPTDPWVSVAVETAIAAPFAATYLVELHLSGQAEFTHHGPVHTTLMLLCGPVTAVPLLLFAAAAQRLPLVTLGLLQYLTPSMQLTWGVLGITSHVADPVGRFRADLGGPGGVQRRRPAKGPRGAVARQE